MFRKMMILCLFFYFGFIPAVFAAPHDPTCPPSHNPYLNGKGLGDLKVQAIFISPTKKRVIIGGKNLTVGDKIRGVKIVYIDEHAVTLQSGQGKFIIEIFQPIIKKPANKKGEIL